MRKQRDVLTLCQSQLGHLTGTSFSFFEAVAVLAFLNTSPLPNWGKSIGDLFELILDILHLSHSVNGGVYTKTGQHSIYLAKNRKKLESMASVQMSLGGVLDLCFLYSRATSADEQRIRISGDIINHKL